MKIQNQYLVAVLVLVISACTVSRVSESSVEAGKHITNTITATLETDVTPQSAEDDSADDPAIYIHPNDATKSIVYGSDKKGGIIAYNMSGKQVAYYNKGKINNIDVRENVVSEGNNITVFAGSDRTNKDIIIATINLDGSLNFEPILGTGILRNKKVYGFCLGNNQDGLYAYINTKQGEIFRFLLKRSNKQWNAELVNTYVLDSQPEGMVADDENNILYVGEENRGIWKFDLSKSGFKPSLLDNSSEENNSNLTYDIEGLAIYKTNDTEGYLMASSQGNNSYAVYEREGNNRYITSFRIVDGVVDGVEETDGIELTNVNLGSTFPKGMMIAQDGFNFDGDIKKSQNFKFIDWREIEKLLK